MPEGLCGGDCWAFRLDGALLFRRRLIRNASIANNRAAIIEPIVTPAIAPPERPPEPEAPLVVEGEGTVVPRDVAATLEMVVVETEDEDALVLVDDCVVDDAVAASSTRSP